ncbi:hypothetical protein C8J57DRAFT_1249731 [Mycena rebaudengoi]|nr:hypothetical protein C8J57DRAFT_1249731 [Mycena rebaudengoi]
MPFTIHSSISGSNSHDVSGILNQVTGNMAQIFNWHDELLASQVDRAGGLPVPSNAMKEQSSGLFDPQGEHRGRKISRRPVSVHIIAPAPSSQHADIINDADVGQREGEGISTHTFNSIGGNMIYVTLYGESVAGLDILYRRFAMSTVHDSPEIFPEPGCHEGIRVSILKHLSVWATDRSPEKKLYHVFNLNTFNGTVQ